MEQQFGGVFLGATLLQQRGAVGGSRAVFVKLQGVKNDLVFPPFGGILQNPFKGMAKIYAADLFEYRTDSNGLKPKIFLLKVFEVANTSSSTSVEIVANGYRHIPFVGDVLMKAPESFSDTGTAGTVTSVVKGDGKYTITLSESIGTVNKGDILVEATEAGPSKRMLVTNINAMAPCDYDTFYEPAKGDEDFDGARYMLTPVLHGTAFIHRMSPIPPAALAMNKSRINGWYEV